MEVQRFSDGGYMVLRVQLKFGASFELDEAARHVLRSIAPEGPRGGDVLALWPDTCTIQRRPKEPFPSFEALRRYLEARLAWKIYQISSLHCLIPTLPIFTDFYRFLPIFRTFLGDFNLQKLPSRGLQTLWE